MVQYQHSQIQVLSAFTAEVSNSGVSSTEYFLGPEWLVDVTRLVRSSLKVGDTSIAQLQRETVLSGRAPGVTTVQVQCLLICLFTHLRLLMHITNTCLLNIKHS